ncbi:MAG: PAS domain S-box protein [Acidobacteriota bacterium]|nr:PAS domain S-box protein [Acidobacteriota bacterium]
MNQIMAGTYNYWLVALSLVIAVLTSYTAITLAERVTASQGAVRHAWLSGGAVAMGTGIWCTHFTGMLAFQLTTPVRYHVPTVAASLLAAILTSKIALLVVSRARRGGVTVLVGSSLTGAGIAAMHSVGMAAMRMQAMPVYHVVALGVSIVLAMLISYAGLMLLFYTRRSNRGKWVKVGAALVLGLAIPAMHYTGMAAVSFELSTRAIDYVNSVDISALAIFTIFGLTLLILGFATMTSVIDQRIRAQDKVLDKERKILRTLIDHIPDVMYVKDLQGRFVLANFELAKRVGLNDPRLLLGKSDFDFYPFELASKFREDELRVMSCGEALIDKEEDGLDSEGTSIPMLTTKVLLRDTKGQITGIAGIGRDITQVKRAETALRVAEQKYRSMYDEALVGICSCDVDFHLVQVNTAMASLLGCASPEEMYQFVTGSLLAKAASPESRTEFLKKMNTQGDVKAFELEMLRKGEEKIWVSSSMRANYEGSSLTGFVGIFEDITERRILREQLLQAQKLESVGQLAAGIAHEINTPVQYIGDNVRFLRDTFKDLVDLNRSYLRLLEAVRGNTLSPEILNEVELAIKRADVEYIFEEIPNAITQTMEGISRVSGLVGAMKEFSHPGTGEKVPVDLNRAIESTVTVTRNEWKYVADMKLSLDAGLPLVRCLPGEFNQVIRNLIVNAAHSITEGIAAGEATKGLISIETRALGGNVEIRVKDNGGGIPEGIRTRIFDPFFTTKEIGKGTGQGLAIARSVIVNKHQGSIDVETDGETGATFIIRLPCEPELAAIQPQVAA